MASMDDLMGRMRARGWKPGVSADEAVVARLEREFDLTLPADYRAFLLAAGGGDTLAPESFTGLWPMGILSGFNRRFRIPWNFPGLFGIANDSFLVYALDFRPVEPLIVSLGLSSSIWDDVVEDASTFQEWLERRIP